MPLETACFMRSVCKLSRVAPVRKCADIGARTRHSFRGGFIDAFNAAPRVDRPTLRRRVPDLTKIQRLIGFTPAVGLDEILNRVIDHTRATLVVQRA